MNLARLGMPGIGQNIESQGLKSKILPNKDLASGRKPLPVDPWDNFLGEPSRIGRSCAFLISQ